MLIDRVFWDGHQKVGWTLQDGQVISRTWKYRPNSVVLLNDLSGVLVVESVEESGATNLSVVNADGVERIRPKPPTEVGRTHGFAYAGYEMGRLVVVIATVGEDIACEFDAVTGTFAGCVPRR
jgi:hypothetical protein